MFPRKSMSRMQQQQQPARGADPQQQSGSSEFQPKPAAQPREQQMGEGSYEATRDYQKRTDEYLKKADVAADAEAEAKYAASCAACAPSARAVAARPSRRARVARRARSRATRRRRAGRG